MIGGQFHVAEWKFGKTSVPLKTRWSAVGSGRESLVWYIVASCQAFSVRKHLFSERRRRTKIAAQLEVVVSGSQPNAAFLNRARQNRCPDRAASVQYLTPLEK
jgi:hypothetical protein